ncbi:MAG: acyl carrier protein [Gammaproteobacteria bacterium]
MKNDLSIPVGIDAFDLVALVTKGERSDLTEKSSIVNTPGWDSLAQLDIMMYLEDHYGVEITEESIEKFSSLSAVMDIMTKGV